MSSPSNSDLDVGITERISLQKQKKKKKKTKPTAVVAATPTERGEHERDTHRAYDPPAGARLLDHAVDAGAFEWDAVNGDEDTEVWLIRAPDWIKSKHLSGLEIDPPSSSRTARVGGLSYKHVSYDVWSVGDGDDDGDDDDAELVGGEELRGLSCLFPREREGGKLYIASKRVSRHIVISARLPTAAAREDQPIVHQNPPRPSYPTDMLKHAFVPYGARSQRTQPEELAMDVDDIQTILDKPTDTPKVKPEKAKESKGKKRKSDAESPKKSKKHKPNA